MKWFNKIGYMPQGPGVLLCPQTMSQARRTRLKRAFTEITSDTVTYVKTVGRITHYNKLIYSYVATYHHKYLHIHGDLHKYLHYCHHCHESLTTSLTYRGMLNGRPVSISILIINGLKPYGQICRNCILLL